MSELDRYDGGGRGSVARRPSRAARRTQERGELDLMQLANSGRLAEARGMIRRHIAEEGMADAAYLGDRARELANGDAFIASLLLPIVQEFGRTTARDVREFGRGF